jgi:dipeptidyl aminopeptidase/acylaminoacyl peptidase
MRRVLTRQALVGASVSLVSLLAAMPSRSTEHPALADLTPADEAAWNIVGNAKLTPDGKWLVYQIGPADGPGQISVVARSLAGSAEHRYSAGAGELGAGHTGMSRSGRWIAFQFVPASSQSADPASPALALVDLETGARRDFPRISRFAFAGAADEELVLAGAGARAGSFTLSILPLSGTADRRFTDVNDFALSPQGTAIAIASARGVQLYDFRTRSLRELERQHGSGYSQLTWSAGGDAVAMLRTSRENVMLVAFTKLRGAAHEAFYLDPQRFKGWPTGFTLASTLQWRDDERGIFFEIKAASPPVVVDPHVPGLSIWHWRDEQLPGAKQPGRVTTVTHWCYVDVSRPQLIRVTDEALASATLSGRGRYVLGYDATRYGVSNRSIVAAVSSLAQIRDYVLIDLQTGERKPLVLGLKVVGRGGLGLEPQLSPDGSEFLYQNGEGDIIAQSVPRGLPRNLTAGLNVRFYLPENDPRTGRAIRDPDGFGSPRVQGWTVDSRSVLVSDHFDVWLLSLQGKAAVNLTFNGHHDNVAYRLVDLTDPPATRALGRRSLVDLQQPLYFQSFELNTGRNGLDRRSPGQTALEALHREFADIRYVRAADAEVYVCWRETSVESLNYFSVNAQWQPGARLTDSNPQQRRFKWSPGARYLSYATAKGASRHASLYLPVGYVEGRAWPTIVVIYKGQSAGIHGFKSLSPNNVNRMLQHGFAVLMPDIVPRLNDAGNAALEDVTAAVEAAVASGITDRERVGLTGFSYGAYETSYIVSHSRLFRAAMAWSGMSNLWSGYGGVYAGRTPNWIMTERDQSYLAGPWWEHWDAYIRNSPLYSASALQTPLLLVHGDRDGAVPFAQSVELFNTLRRMGDKAVVLLQYAGEGHLFSPGADLDVATRKLQFFDHFLRGEPAPGWWSEGLSRPGRSMPGAGEPADKL